MSRMTIYYFSGTGNSLYAAKKLQKLLPEAELIPIASMVGKQDIRAASQVVGFVFPIHLSTIPIFILDFIRRLDLSSAEYVFAVATRFGTQHSAFAELDKVLKGKRKRLNAAVSLNMPSNDPKFGFKELPLAEMEREKLISDEGLAILAQAIGKGEDCRGKDTSYTTRVPLVGMLAWLVKLTDNLQPRAYADEKCGGCGICALVCPSGKIIMKDGRPFWQKGVKCFKCNACLSYCPNQAVQIKGYTEGKGRYSHPYASEEDIAQQKESS